MKGKNKPVSSGKKRFLWLIVVGLMGMLLATGCGYRMRGTESLAGGYRSVAIEIFTNRTYESLVENYLYNSLVEEFARSKNLRVVPAGQAEVLIRGTITNISSYAISYSSDDKTYEYRVTLNIDVEAVAADSGKIIWRRSGMHDDDEYKANLEPLTIDRNRQIALRRICKVLAENIHDGLFTNF
jgi:hypothetical protein